jgi:menaquinone-dependent protoporphyrinogen oxidase
MKVLVSVESKHGSTEEIASAIVAELMATGLEVDSIEPLRVESLAGYEAVVLGSAVYMGNWMPGVRKFVERHREALKQRDVWLFSSGPIGDPPKPEEDPAGAKMLEETGAREHRVFSGKLDQGRLGIAEKLVVKAIHAPEGDFRDWEGIRAWARDIALALKQPVAARPA